MKKAFHWLLPLELAILGILAFLVPHADAASIFPVSLTVQPATVPADGYATVSVSSAPLRLDNGSLISDETIFTIQSGTGGETGSTGFAIVSSDLDLARPGVQVKSVQGVVQFSLRAGTTLGEHAGLLTSDEFAGYVVRQPFTLMHERHTPYTISSLVVQPEAPTTADSIQVHLIGNTPTPSWQVTYGTPYRADDTNHAVIRVDITSTRSVDAGASVPQQENILSQDITLPALTEAGEYALRFFENGTLIKEHVFNVYRDDAVNVFSDVSEQYWAFEYIAALFRDHVISGYDDGTFRPEHSITRAELLKIIMRSSEIVLDEAAPNNFTDVSDDAWYRPYIATAEKLTIVSGVTDDAGNQVFAPNNPVRRAEALKILFRVFGIPTVRVRELSFDDTESWQNEYIETAVAYDLAHGYGNRVFGPNRPITRAEASKIIDRTRKLEDSTIDFTQSGSGAETELNLSGSGAEIAESGKASYYGTKFTGRRTASGEIFDHEKFTAAHKTLPFGTRLLVTNVSNDKSVEVVVNDRGPYVEGRILDLSDAAFSAIAKLSQGVADVVYRIL